MNERTPTCYVIAGPNGAGKTTFAMTYLPTITACRDFINADEIARGLSPLDFEAGLLKAGKIFMRMLNERIAGRKDFAFETTLSGRAYLPKIDAWRRDGWRVVLFYLYIPNARFSAMRVAQRVLQGGHDIPADDILRRYPRSVRNAFAYADHCDETYCLDNRQNRIAPIFEKRAGGEFIIQDKGLYQEMRKVADNER